MWIFKPTTDFIHLYIAKFCSQNLYYIPKYNLKLCVLKTKNKYQAYLIIFSMFKFLNVYFLYRLKIALKYFNVKFKLRRGFSIRKFKKFFKRSILTKHTLIFYDLDFLEFFLDLDNFKFISLLSQLFVTFFVNYNNVKDFTSCQRILFLQSYRHFI
jgi:hypothetical protein